MPKFWLQKEGNMT